MATNNAGQLTYGGQDKPPSLSGETEYASEVGVPGGLFHADYKRHDDLKQMLDSNKDSLKLEAMKRIIGVGRDDSKLENLSPTHLIRSIRSDGGQRERRLRAVPRRRQKRRLQKH